MQYLSRGKYGTGEPFGAGWREVRTNSGEGSLERWDSKVGVQGAAGVVRCWVVVDIVRRRVRRRRTGGEAMMSLLAIQRGELSRRSSSKVYASIVVFVTTKRVKTGGRSK